MPVIAPLAGWRFDPGKVDYSRVCIPPACEIDPGLQEDLYKLDDRNCVRLVACRSDQSSVAGHLDNWREEGLFLQDKPAMYVYEQSFPWYGERAHRRGFIAKVLLSDIGSDRIYAISKADPEEVEKQFQLIKARRCNLEPVVAVLTDPSSDISRSLHEMCKYEPTSSFHSEGDVMNHFWVQDNYELASSFCSGCSQENLIVVSRPEIYDAAILYRNSVREAMKVAGHAPPALGGLECDYVMMAILPDGDPGLKASPVHRILHGFALEDIGMLPKIIGEFFDLEEMDNLDSLMWKVGESTVPAFGFALRGKLYCCVRNIVEAPALAFAGMPEGWPELDLIALRRLVFLKIPGWQTDSHRKVELSADTASTIELLEQKNTWAQCAFLMRPPSMDQLRNLSRSGSMLPEDAVRFTPNPLTGLVFNLFY